MIDVQRAVRSAESYARALFPESELHTLRLEEVVLADDGARWNITLGWVEPAVSRNGLLYPVGLQRLPRVYKVFVVNAGTGVVEAMKIRDVE